jgi:hypothetical protein
MAFIDEGYDPSVRCADTSPASLGRGILVPHQNTGKVPSGSSRHLRLMASSSPLFLMA